MTNNVIKELSTVELQERLSAERLRLNMMKINHSVNPLDNPNQIKSLKKDIARILTELRRREGLSQDNN